MPFLGWRFNGMEEWLTIATLLVGEHAAVDDVGQSASARA